MNDLSTLYEWFDKNIDITYFSSTVTKEEDELIHLVLHAQHKDSDTVDIYISPEGHVRVEGASPYDGCPHDDVVRLDQEGWTEYICKRCRKVFSLDEYRERIDGYTGC